MYCNKDLENNNIDNNINEMFLINFNKKYKFNLDIINNNFKGIYNDCLFVLKSINDVNIIKNYIYMD